MKKRAIEIMATNVPIFVVVSKPCSENRFLDHSVRHRFARITTQHATTLMSGEFGFPSLMYSTWSDAFQASITGDIWSLNGFYMPMSPAWRDGVGPPGVSTGRNLFTAHLAFTTFVIWARIESHTKTFWPDGWCRTRWGTKTPTTWVKNYSPTPSLATPRTSSLRAPIYHRPLPSKLPPERVFYRKLGLRESQWIAFKQTLLTWERHVWPQ